MKRLPIHWWSRGREGKGERGRREEKGESGVPISEESLGESEISSSAPL